MKKTKKKLIAGMTVGLLVLSAISDMPALAEAPPADDSNPAERAADGSAALEEDAAGFPGAAELPDSEPVLNVDIPLTLDITIDPLEIGGRGQLYSDAYEIRNRGDTEVLLTFSEFEVIFANDTDFEALSAPFDESSGSELKAVYMLLHFGRADTAPVVMTDARDSRVTVPLAAASEGAADERSALSLYFSGGVNHEPRAEWKTGDVKIKLTYRLESVPVSEYETMREAAEGIFPEDTAPVFPAEGEEALPGEEPAAPPSEGSPPLTESDENATKAAVSYPEQQQE